MLNRTDAILAGFTSVAVLTICFLTYQMLKEPDTKVAKVRPTQAISTPVVFSDAQKRARSQHVREKVKKLNPSKASFADLPKNTQTAKPILISTTTTTSTMDQNPTAKEIERLESIPSLKDIHFDFNKGELPEEAQTQLMSHARILKSEKWDVLIQGHTDSQGSVGFNLRVGQKRAEAVKEYLVMQEVPNARMHIISLGEFEQACKQDTEACAINNRRVTFSLVKRDAEILPDDTGRRMTEDHNEDPTQTKNVTETVEKEKETQS